MKKKVFISLLSFFLVMLLTSVAVVLQDNGIAGYTGSPGESNCTDCHNSFALNSNGGSITISTTPSLTGNQYTPNTTYTVMVTVAKTGHSLFGFGTEILNSSNTNAGTLAITNSTSTQLKSFGSKTNVVHQLNGGAAAESKTFSFKWTAPASGNATIYASGVAANSDGSTTNDYVYNTSLSLSATTTGIEDTFSDKTLSIFPNPTSEYIYVNYTLTRPSSVIVALTNVNGETVVKWLKEAKNAGEQNERLDIPASVAKGVYFISLTIDGAITSKKMVID